MLLFQLISYILFDSSMADRLKASHASEHTAFIFIIEIGLMLLVGRLLGELLQRIGQPAVMGQLIAGVVIGKSVFGAVAPSSYNWIFPDSVAQKTMIDAISQLGILMLLLLTGMETDLSLVRKMRSTALYSSLSGVLLPFACGFALGEFLPDSMLPDPSTRLVTALFLATALSISSVKIVAMVLMEVDFLRRNVGQIILASAILDDTIGWIIIALIGGLASEGSVNVKSLTFSVVGTVLFLVVCLTFGGAVVARVIRWTNDRLVIEAPVITAMLLVMFLLALVTDLIGVHTVLGAFVAGILIGQSPILTRHIEEQFRGLIVALFAPVFFAVAGLSIDLSVLGSVHFLELAVALILIASFGKVVGCYVGGRLGGLGIQEATALAIGMNARGSTEVIVATIGLQMGVLSRDIFTLIVVMAIITTMVTPPLLRWALARIPATGEEKQRLDKEAAEEKDFVPKIERLLITVDKSRDGLLAARLAGLFAGTRKVMATVLDLAQVGGAGTLSIRESALDIVKTAMEFAAHRTKKGEDVDLSAFPPSGLSSHSPSNETPATVLNEAKKGYDMLFLGIAKTPGSNGDQQVRFSVPVQDIVRGFEGAMAIAVAKGDELSLPEPDALNILVPTKGTDYSRRAAEVAIAIAKSCGCSVTAMHVAPPVEESNFLRNRRDTFNAGRLLVNDIQALGEREGVKVIPMVKVRRNSQGAILRQIDRGRHNLVVLGVKVRPGEKLFFGHSIDVLMDRTPCSLLIVNS